MESILPIVALSATGPIIGSAIGMMRAPGMRMMHNMLSATAGSMIYISADELIPTFSFKLSNHSTVFSLIVGVVFVVLLGLA